MGYENLDENSIQAKKTKSSLEKLDEKVGGIPDWACHAFGIATTCGVFVCLLAGAIMVATSSASAVTTSGYTLLYVGGLMVLAPIVYASWVAKYNKKLFGKWKIRKEKKATPLELVATDGSAKLSIMTMPTNGDYHLWSKVLPQSIALPPGASHKPHIVTKEEDDEESLLEKRLSLLQNGTPIAATDKASLRYSEEDSDRGSMRDTGINTMSTTAADDFLQRKSTAVSVSESDFDKYTVSTSASQELVDRHISVDSEIVDIDDERIERVEVYLTEQEREAVKSVELATVHEKTTTSTMERTFYSGSTAETTEFTEASTLPIRRKDEAVVIVEEVHVPEHARMEIEEPPTPEDIVQVENLSEKGSVRKPKSKPVIVEGEHPIKYNDVTVLTVFDDLDKLAVEKEEVKEEITAPVVVDKKEEIVEEIKEPEEEEVTEQQDEPDEEPEVTEEVKAEENLETVVKEDDQRQVVKIDITSRRSKEIYIDLDEEEEKKTKAIKTVQEESLLKEDINVTEEEEKKPTIIETVKEVSPLKEERDVIERDFVEPSTSKEIQKETEPVEEAPKRSIYQNRKLVVGMVSQFESREATVKAAQEKEVIIVEKDVRQIVEEKEAEIKEDIKTTYEKEVKEIYEKADAEVAESAAEVEEFPRVEVETQFEEEIKEVETKVEEETQDLHDEIEEKQEEIKEMQEEIMEKQEEINEIQEDIEEKQEDVKEVQEEIEEKQEEIEEIQEDIEEKQEDVKEVQEEIEEKQEEIEERQEEINEIQEEIMEKQEEIKDIQEEIEEKKEEITETQEEVKEVIQEKRVEIKEKTVIIVEKVQEEVKEDTVDQEETQESEEKQRVETESEETTEVKKTIVVKETKEVKVEKTVTFSEDEDEIIGEQEPEETVTSYIEEKPAVVAPKKERSKAFSEAHSNLETFFKQKKESPEESPDASPRFSPRAERRPSAPKIDIKARTKFLQSILFQEEPEKPPIKRTNKPWTRPTFGEPPAPPPSLPFRNVGPPKPPTPVVPPSVALLREKEVIIETMPEEKKEEVEETKEPEVESTVPPAPPPPPSLPLGLTTTDIVVDEQSNVTESVEIKETVYEEPVPSSPPPPPPPPPPPFFTSSATEVKLQEKTKTDKAIEEEKTSKETNVTVQSEEISKTEKAIAEIYAGKETKSHESEEASTSEVITAYASVEVEKESEKVTVTEETEVIQKETTVKVVDTNNTDEVDEVAVEEAEVTAETEQEEAREVNAESVKKVYQSLIMPKVFSAKRETVTFKPIVPSPPKSPQKVRKKLRSPPPPPSEPFLPTEEFLPDEASPPKKIKTDDREIIPTTVEDPTEIAQVETEATVTEESRFNQEADEIINKSDDLSAEERAQIEDFFNDTDQEKLTVEETSEEVKLDSENEEVVKQETVETVTTKEEVTEVAEQDTSTVVVEEVTMQTEEIIEENKFTYKADSLKVSNKDDVMKALKTKKSDESFKPQRLVKNRIEALFGPSVEPSPTSSAEIVQEEKQALTRSESFEKREELAIAEEEKELEKEIEILELKKAKSEEESVEVLKVQKEIETTEEKVRTETEAEFETTTLKVESKETTISKIVETSQEAEDEETVKEQKTELGAATLEVESKETGVKVIAETSQEVKTQETVEEEKTEFESVKLEEERREEREAVVETEKVVETEETVKEQKTEEATAVEGEVNVSKDVETSKVVETEEKVEGDAEIIVEKVEESVQIEQESNITEAAQKAETTESFTKELEKIYEKDTVAEVTTEETSFTKELEKIYERDDVAEVVVDTAETSAEKTEAVMAVEVEDEQQKSEDKTVETKPESEVDVTESLVSETNKTPEVETYEEAVVQTEETAEQKTTEVVSVEAVTEVEEFKKEEEINEIKSVTEKSLKYEVIDSASTSDVKEVVQSKTATEAEEVTESQISDVKKVIQSQESENTEDKAVIENKSFQSENIKYEVIEDDATQSNDVAPQEEKPVFFPLGGLKKPAPHKVEINLDEADRSPVEPGVIEKEAPPVVPPRTKKIPEKKERAEGPTAKHVATVEISDDKVEAKSVSKINVDEFVASEQSKEVLESTEVIASEQKQEITRSVEAQESSETTTKEESTKITEQQESTTEIEKQESTTTTEKQESTTITEKAIVHAESEKQEEQFEHISKVQVDNKATDEGTAEATERHISSITVDSAEEKPVPAPTNVLEPTPDESTPTPAEQPIKHITTVPLGNEPDELEDPPKTNDEPGNETKKEEAKVEQQSIVPAAFLGQLQSVYSTDKQDSETSALTNGTGDGTTEDQNQNDENNNNEHTTTQPTTVTSTPSSHKSHVTKKPPFQMEAIKEEDPPILNGHLVNGDVDEMQNNGVKNIDASSETNPLINSHLAVSPQSSITL